jgi:hypothetical protein
LAVKEVADGLVGVTGHRGDEACNL